MKRPTLADLEAKVQSIGRLLNSAIDADDGYGFALIIFNLGEKGNMTYVSNAKRESMITALEEMLVYLKAGAVAPHGQPNHPANKQGKA